MNKKTLISILTPVFNQSSYIRETIHSVLAQTYRNWEWVILDDGSTDDTGDIIQRVKDGRIRYSFQDHTGANFHARTFNRALAMCSGDLIAMLDGDDYWPPKKLETQVKTFDDAGIVLSYGESFLVNRKGKKIGYVGLPKDPRIACNDPVGSALETFLFDHSCFMANSTVMVRRGTLSSLGGFIEAKDMGQDFPTWTRLSLEGRFSALPLCLGYYRKHASSTSSGRNPECSFDGETSFLRGFIIRNEKKLNELGLSYDRECLEKHWEELRKYVPYNSAMYKLMLGLFKDAKVEFKRFLESKPSLKTRLIYALINLSGLIQYDIVNPIAMVKERLRRIL